MPPFGPPVGCECSNYFELNGKPQHEDDCPLAQSDESVVDWCERQILEERAFEIGYDDDVEDDVYDLIVDSSRRREVHLRAPSEDDA